MRQKTVALSLIGLLFLTSGLLAQPEGRHGPKAMRSQQGLNLTDEQEAKMQELKLNFERQKLPLQNQLQSLSGELKLAITAEKFDEGKAQNLVNQIQKVRAQLQMMRIRHLQDVRQLLTPEQRQKFDMHILSGKGQWGDGGPGDRKPFGGRAPFHPRMNDEQP